MTNAHKSAADESSCEQLISHGAQAHVGYEERVHLIKSRLREEKDVPGASVQQSIALLDQLAATEIGRFLIENRGLNAYWTHQLVTYRPGTMAARSPTDFEYRIFETLPAALATRERFGIFQQHLQGLLRPGAVLASIPCGLMGELLLLDYAGFDDIKLIGIDLDQTALDGALAVARERGLTDRVELRRADAWACGLYADVDVLTSNGLNIYEADDARVTALYRAFFDALKPGGTLITSFLAPPPTLSPQSPWNMAEIDKEALSLQQVLFVRLIEAKWSAFRTHDQTRQQLEAAGFCCIEFIDDRARMFPTVVAKKTG
ncbi:MAG: hypothetical protein QOH33_562 [Paraburkholderia sp.]|nr:hypothetical protein [Paraburkholderia sp.]